MIRINLAGPAGSIMPGAAGDPLGLGGADIIVAPDETRKEGLKRILIILIFPVALYFYQTQNLPDIRAQLNQRNQTLQELTTYNAQMSSSVVEIKKFTEDQAKIQARIGILEKLSKERQNEIRILDLFQQVIPEKLWFTKLDVQGPRVTITGMAMSDFDISALMESLSRSVFFVDVNLLNSSEQVTDGIVFKKFEITCLTERNQP